MGIQGLLPFLRDASTQVNVKMLAGYTVAIDAYCWIYRGAFACAMDLARGEKSDMYVRFCLKYVNMLLSHGIKPVMVFDGCNLPSKKGVEESRRERRHLYLQKGKQFLRDGNTAQARECFQKCINVTPQMAQEVMEACRAISVDCIVAPYEADAQLAYLNKCGIAQAVITEDSDLLAFGCDRVIFKLDLNGNGTMIEKHRLSQCMKIKAQNFTFDKFRYMCILCGCDYLPSLHGIGPAKAAKVLSLTNQSDMTKVLRKIGTYLKSSIVAPSEYIEGFVKADNTFLYQLAFDPMKREVVPLHEYPDGVTAADVPYAGEYKPRKMALGMAMGNININTGETIGDFDPLTYKPPPSSTWHGANNVTATTPRHKLSIWHPHYKTGPKYGTLDLKEVKTSFTKGKEMTVKAPTFLRKEEAKPAESTDVCTDSELAAMYGSPPTSTKNVEKKNSAKDGNCKPRKRLAIRPSRSLDGAGETIVVSRHFANSYQQAVKDLQTRRTSTDDIPVSQDTFLDIIDKDCSNDASEDTSKSVALHNVSDEKKEEDGSVGRTTPSWKRTLQSFQRQGKMGSKTESSSRVEKRKRVISEDQDEETNDKEIEVDVSTNASTATSNSSLMNAFKESVQKESHKEVHKNPFKVATPKQGSAFSWTGTSDKKIGLKSSISSLEGFRYSSLSQAKRKKALGEEGSDTTNSQKSVAKLPEEESLSGSSVEDETLKASLSEASVSGYDKWSMYSMDTFTPTESQNSASTNLSQGSQYFTASEGNDSQVSKTQMSQLSENRSEEDVTQSQQPVCSQGISLDIERNSQENTTEGSLREDTCTSDGIPQQVSSYFGKSVLSNEDQTAPGQRAVVQDMGRRAMEDGVSTTRMGKPARGKSRQVGLSRRSCPSQNKRMSNNENSSVQTKISNFLKKDFSFSKGSRQVAKGQPIRKPMSPSKDNVVVDCTPETEPGIAVSFNGAKVKRNIFDKE